MISYAPDGKERWRHALGPFDAPYGMDRPPIVADGKVLLLCYELRDIGSDFSSRWMSATDISCGICHGPKRLRLFQHRQFRNGRRRPGAGDRFRFRSGGGIFNRYRREALVGPRHGMGGKISSGGGWADTLFVAFRGMESPCRTGPAKGQAVRRDAEATRRLTMTGSPRNPTNSDGGDEAALVLFDLDHDGVISEREWSIHRARGDAGNGLFAIRLGGEGDIRPGYEQSLCVIRNRSPTSRHLSSTRCAAHVCSVRGGIMHGASTEGKARYSSRAAS